MPTTLLFCIVVCYTFQLPIMTNLEEVLKAKGIKKKWIANQLAVRPETVSRWCKGKTVPDIKKKALSRILGISVEKLFHND